MSHIFQYVLLFAVTQHYRDKGKICHLIQFLTDVLVAAVSDICLLDPKCTVAASHLLSHSGVVFMLMNERHNSEAVVYLHLSSGSWIYSYSKPRNDTYITLQ